MDQDAVRSEKKRLRAEILKIRAAYSEETVSRNSNVIIEKLIAMDEYRDSNTVMCFVDFKKEVRAREIIRHALEQGKRVLVPVIVKEPDGAKTMKASHLLDFTEDLEPGTMGILEPKPNRRRFVEPGEIDFFVAPGVAFDVTKNRLGYGGRFHDIMFKKLRADCKKVAVCFDFQVLQRFPVLS
jgi:5-formyltetrahydrofolate cyclo-ligase